MRDSYHKLTDDKTAVKIVCRAQANSAETTANIGKYRVLMSRHPTFV